MFSDDEFDSPIDAERLLKDAVKEIIKHENADSFLNWIAENIQNYLIGISKEALQAVPFPPQMSIILGRSIWNATPLPSNHLKPKRLPEPNRNAPCICGSGRKYKQCCINAPTLPDLDEEMMLSMVASRLPEKRLKALLDNQAFSHQGLLVLAENYIEEEKYRKAAILLERVFEEPIRKKGELEDYILSTLCNLYDDLGYNNKKMTLLTRVINQVGKSPLRSGSWQRMATICADTDDIPSAWRFFHLAQRDDPNSSSLGLLEVQLLLNENQSEKAAKRASFWVKRLERQGLHDDPMLDFLRQIAKDPHLAMMQASGIAPENEDLLRLSEWVKTDNSKPVTLYQCELFDAGDSEDDDSEPTDNTRKPEAQLQAPNTVDQIEKRWFSHVGGLDPNEITNWLPEGADIWMGFIEKHPIAIDSLVILDEIISAVSNHPMGVTPWTEELILLPLLQRAEKIVLKALNGRDIAFIWYSLNNRPALRLLMSKAYAHIQRGETRSAIQIMEQVLSLNPDDNQGVRAMLINEYITTGDNEKAICLADNYPDDIHADILYGKVLALYKLQDYENAKKALKIAFEQLPKVVTYLTRKRIKQPEMDESRFTLGGDDQAWLYRESARELWLAEPGALEWLKKVTK